jgi:hypothetical protein
MKLMTNKSGSSSVEAVWNEAGSARRSVDTAKPQTRGSWGRGADVLVDERNRSQSCVRY